MGPTLTGPIIGSAIAPMTSGSRDLSEDRNVEPGERPRNHDWTIDGNRRISPPVPQSLLVTAKPCGPTELRRRTGSPRVSSRIQFDTATVEGESISGEIETARKP